MQTREQQDATSQAPASPIPDTAKARELSVRASCDPRTILREAKRPGSVKGLSGERARKVLEEWRSEGAKGAAA